MSSGDAVVGHLAQVLVDDGRDDAACQGLEPRLFYPDELPRPSRAPLGRRVRFAVLVLRLQCLVDAMCMDRSPARGAGWAHARAACQVVRRVELLRTAHAEPRLRPHDVPSEPSRCTREPRRARR